MATMETENKNGASKARTTEERVAQLEMLNAEALIGGGAERLAKHKEGGRLTARERLDVLLDPGSFVEMDRFVTHRSQNFGFKRVTHLRVESIGEVPIPEQDTTRRLTDHRSRRWR